MINMVYLPVIDVPSYYNILVSYLSYCTYLTRLFRGGPLFSRATSRDKPELAMMFFKGAFVSGRVSTRVHTQVPRYIPEHPGTYPSMTKYHHVRYPGIPECIDIYAEFVKVLPTELHG